MGNFQASKLCCRQICSAGLASQDRSICFNLISPYFFLQGHQLYCNPPLATSELGAAGCCSLLELNFLACQAACFEKSVPKRYIKTEVYGRVEPSRYKTKVLKSDLGDDVRVVKLKHQFLSIITNQLLQDITSSGCSILEIFLTGKFKIDTDGCQERIKLKNPARRSRMTYMHDVHNPKSANKKALGTLHSTDPPNR